MLTHRRKSRKMGQVGGGGGTPLSPTERRDGLRQGHGLGASRAPGRIYARRPCRRPLVDRRSTPTRPPGRIRSTDCKNAMFFKGAVGYACRADRTNRHFVGVGRAPTSMAENILQDDLIEAPKMTQHRFQIWDTQSPDGPT